MSEAVTNDIIFEVLKKIQADLFIVKRDVGDMKLRLNVVEEHLGSLVVSAAGMNHRLDGHDIRFDRIETRLGLIDA